MTAVWPLFIYGTAIHLPASMQGELAFRPISYTPWPVDESYEGERVRIAVGPVNNRQLRWAGNSTVECVTCVTWMGARRQQAAQVCVRRGEVSRS